MKKLRVLDLASKVLPFILILSSTLALADADNAWGGAFVEGLDQVHTQVEHKTHSAPSTKSRKPYEVLVRQEGVCIEDAGEFSWIGQSPPSTTRNLVQKGTATQALYQRIRMNPDGSRTPLKLECRPLPKEMPAKTSPQQGRDPLTVRVEEWLQVSAPVIGGLPKGTEERPGLTGLETAFWVEGATVWAPPPTTLGGTQVEVQAWPAEYQWDTGDGSPPPGSAGPSEHAYVSTCPGSEEGPPATACGGTTAQPQVVHVYETKSSLGFPSSSAYTVKVVTVWHARYRVLRPTGAGPWVPLPERQTESSQPYQVQEVRSALVP